MSAIRIGFSTVNLYKVLPENKPLGQPVEALGFYMSDDRHSSFILVSDFMDFNLKTVRTLEDSVRSVLPEDSLIHIVTTHNHGAAVCGNLDMDLYGKLAVQCAVEAQRKSCPAKIRSIRTLSDPDLNMIRRIYIPEAEGCATCFFGIGPDTRRNGGPFVQNFVDGLKQGQLNYVGGDSGKEPYQAFPEADHELFAMEFAAESDGHPLGTLVRYAAHAVTCNDGTVCYTSDYPYYIRERMKQYFGGDSIFFNGPCADIAPTLLKKSIGTAEKLGYTLADQVTELLKQQPFSSLSEFDDHLFKIALPVRKEVLENKVDIGIMPDDLPGRRRFLERQNLEKTLPFLQEKYREGEIQLSDSVEVALGLLRLNQEHFLFFPGETFSETGNAVKFAFPQLHLTTVTEHGRTVMYIPTAEAFLNGGYETICELTAADAEAVLREHTIRFLKEYNSRIQQTREL